MKKVLILIFGALVALPAICQTPFNDVLPFPDTTNMEKRFVFSYPKPFAPQGEIRSDLFRVKWGKMTDLFVNTGGLINYQIESDKGNAHVKTMVRLLTQQIPMNADIKTEELVHVEKLIEEIAKPGVYVPPTTTPGTPVFHEHVSDHGPIVYGAGWIKAANQIWTKKFADENVSVSYNVGVTASYQFTGRKVEVVAEKCDNHGKVKIEILKAQNVIKTDVIDMYQKTGTETAPATELNVCPAGVVGVIYSSGDLPLDTYTIRTSLESKDMTKVPARDSYVFDGYKIYK